MRVLAPQYSSHRTGMPSISRLCKCRSERVSSIPIRAFVHQSQHSGSDSTSGTANSLHNTASTSKQGSHSTPASAASHSASATVAQRNENENSTMHIPVGALEGTNLFSMDDDSDYLLTAEDLLTA